MDVENEILASECVSEFSGAGLIGWQEKTQKNMTVSKVFKYTTHFNITMQRKENDLFCFDDSNAYGEYFSLDLTVWEEVSFSIDDHKRINIGRLHAEKEIRLFIKIGNDDGVKTSDDLISFNRKTWAELRRVRGENRGLPLECNKNGTIWIGDRYLNNEIKIFIRRG